MSNPFRALLVSCLLGLSTVAGAQGDFVISLSSPDSPTYVGTPQRWSLTIQNISGASFQTPAGTELIKATFPDGVQIGNPSLGSCSNGCTPFSCDITDQTLTCTATEAALWNDNGALSIVLQMTPTAAGSYDPTMPPGSCRVDANDLVAETNEDNNDCTWDDAPLVVRDLPDNLIEDWLTVTMWDNVVRRYELDGNVVTWAEVVDGDEAPYHALNDIIRHPSTGDVYVFQRPYGTASHSLGIYVPGQGITPIGDTGLSLYDSTFTDDGTFYVMGRDGKLYTLDPATAVPTQQCDTFRSSDTLAGDDSDTTIHSALAWDATAGLIQLADDTLYFLDTSTLPLADPSLACPESQVVDSSSELDAVFAAEFFDGQLYMTNNGRELFIVALDGAVGQLADMPYHAHGLIPYDAPLPAPPLGCPADHYVAIGQRFSDAANLFAVDIRTGTVGYLRDLPTDKLRAIDVDPDSGEILAISQDPDILHRFDPCAGPLQGEQLAIDTEGRNLAMDFGVEGVLRTVGNFRTGNFTADNRLQTIDTGTGDRIVVGTLEDQVAAMAVHDGELFIDDWDDLSDEEEDITTELGVYDLADVDAGVARSIPLSYVGDVPVGMLRRLVALDVGRSGTPFYGIIQRTERNGSIDSEVALPNALVTIDRDGRVVSRVDLPATTVHYAGRDAALLSDDFEEDGAN